MNLKRYDWLVKLVNKNKLSKGAEVGAATGNTTIRLMQSCPLLDLIVVDDWRPIPESNQWNKNDLKEKFHFKLRDYKSRLTILEGLSWEMADKVPNGSLDFVFIDASHDEESVIKDIRAWMPKIKSGGILCGHDLTMPGVDAALKKLGINYTDTKIDKVWYTEV